MQSSKSFHWDNETDFSWFYCCSAHSMGEWGTVISCSFLKKQWVIIARLVKPSLGGYACPYSKFQYPSFCLVRSKPCPCYSVTIKKIIIVFVLFFIIVTQFQSVFMSLIVAINNYCRLCYVYVTVTRACRLLRFHPNSVSLVRKIHWSMFDCL